MIKYAMELCYVGTRYAGWQSQKNAVSVQNKINEALSIILKREIQTVSSSRTDTGVHAKQQFCHFEFDFSLPKNIVRQLNGMLPNDIAVHAIYQVPDTFHARFDAIHRSYEYHIIQKKNPFLYQKAYFLTRRLDIEQMNKGAEILLKTINFQSFCKTRSETKSYLCKLRYAYWKEISDKHLVFYISSNRFLYGMVRSIVGTLIELGENKITLTEFEEIVDSQDRKKAKYAAPAEGLFLTEVAYPWDWQTFPSWQ
ncbi:MAG: tRNA pseudouridine(38-40) synthase TruA [Bacteroidia bacterium]|nr:tRNA pseudouridine(38-40) synthase TruA [Bacteroidia bacterium]MDW8348092.1 tRNA pseudouridine(38-40) synthase TruA [Bacteroidia bacterium]